jgi:mRNA-degrading endonuclease RelE of RelBE toxin-antitoxin system
MIKESKMEKPKNLSDFKPHFKEFLKNLDEHELKAIQELINEFSKINKQTYFKKSFIEELKYKIFEKDDGSYDLLNGLSILSGYFNTYVIGTEVYELLSSIITMLMNNKTEELKKITVDIDIRDDIPGYLTGIYYTVLLLLLLPDIFKIQTK